MVTGRSGSGKSTLFRAIAGIWPFGSRPRGAAAGRCLFLPQRPYIPLGTLAPRRSPIPRRRSALSDEAGHGAGARGCRACRGLVPHLDEDENWAQRLSGGEQQRVALARALLAKPDWLFLDEATASLDPESEAHLYRTLKQRLPDTTIVSIAHRPTVAQFHDHRLVFRREEGKPGQLVRAEPAPASA